MGLLLDGEQYVRQPISERKRTTSIIHPASIVNWRLWLKLCSKLGVSVTPGARFCWRRQFLILSPGRSVSTLPQALQHDPGCSPPSPPPHREHALSNMPILAGSRPFGLARTPIRRPAAAAFPDAPRRSGKFRPPWPFGWVRNIPGY